MRDSLYIFILLMLIVWSGYVPWQVEGEEEPITVVTATRYKTNDALAAMIPKKLSELVGKFRMGGYKEGVEAGEQVSYDGVSWIWVMSVRRFVGREVRTYELGSLFSAIDDQCYTVGSDNYKRYRQTSILANTEILQIFVYVLKVVLGQEMQKQESSNVVTAFRYLDTKEAYKEKFPMDTNFMSQSMKQAQAQMMQQKDPTQPFNYHESEKGFHIIIRVKVKSRTHPPSQLINLIDLYAWPMVHSQASSTALPPRPHPFHTLILVSLPQIYMLVTVTPDNDPIPPDSAHSSIFQQPYPVLNLAIPFASPFEIAHRGYIKFPPKLRDRFLDMALPFFDNVQTAMLVFSAANQHLAPSASSSSNTLIPKEDSLTTTLNHGN